MSSLRYLCVVCIIVALAASSGLQDDPIEGEAIQYLDGVWTASNGGSLSIDGNVPGDLITDLHRAGKVGDPIYEENWLKDSDVWSGSDWTYSTQFTIKKTQNTKATWLVFDGVKMGAFVFLNGKKVGEVSDQFLRYEFPVSTMLEATNKLSLVFPKNNTPDCEGRYMACTGGWDWAPYSNTLDQHGSHTLSKGIWKSVYLVQIADAAITNIVPQIKYLGDYPTEPLTDSHEGFTVNTRLYLFVPEDVTGSLEITSSWGGHLNKPVSLKAGATYLDFSVPAMGVKLWWPAGSGGQTLYHMTATVTGPKSKVSITRRIGFRVFALVTANDTVPGDLKGKDGSGTDTMRFRVNGANIFARGANMIPMEEFEGRANDAAFIRLVQSAKDGNMNILRVWGGGIFLYNAFYDACDELGILLYHDMMYAQNGHAPTNSTKQANEIAHQVKRLSHHPSIIIWDACNECNGGGLYASFVTAQVIKVDQSRPVWPSSPSGGWNAGVERLYGLPDGVKLNPRGRSPIETHGPYQHGNGYPGGAVNGGDKLILFPSNIPPALKIAPMSIHLKGTFASEFGCVAMSSFESMSKTLTGPKDWSLHSPPMKQRNYPCDNIIIVYWGQQNFSEYGEQAFKKQLYQCLIGQALNLKSNVEVRRATNNFGTIIWQYNEIWPTGGWGSIEYGTPVPGQVIGGRWKPSHYFYKASVFTDIIASCGADGYCFVKNDGISAFKGSLSFDLVHFDTGKVDSIIPKLDLDMKPGCAVMEGFCIKSNEGAECWSLSKIFDYYTCPKGGSDCIAVITVTDNTNNVVMKNVLALDVPGSMNLQKANIKFTIKQDGDNAMISITTDAVAAYVVLTTESPGRFSDNAFLLMPGTTDIEFLPFGKLDMDLLTKTLRLEHAQEYL